MSKVRFRLEPGLNRRRINFDRIVDLLIQLRLNPEIDEDTPIMEKSNGLWIAPQANHDLVVVYCVNGDDKETVEETLQSFASFYPLFMPMPEPQPRLFFYFTGKTDGDYLICQVTFVGPDRFSWNIVGFNRLVAD